MSGETVVEGANTRLDDTAMLLGGREGIPITIVTGFLGSGKTSLINRLLADPALADCAVLVNELGEIGLDHLFIRQISENVSLLASGCLCCATRGDLVDALRDLFIQRLKGDLPPFKRIIIETSGLADPVPILQTLITDPLLLERFRLTGIVTLFDAVHGQSQIDRHQELLRQIVLADRIVLTKLDCTPAGSAEPLSTFLHHLNPTAPIFRADALTDMPGILLEPCDADPRMRPVQWASSLARAAGETGTYPFFFTRRASHSPGVTSATLRCLQPVRWPMLMKWLSDLLERDGEHILRIKGIVNAAGESNPLAVHGIRHVFYPATPLLGWPDDTHDTRLVVIAQDFDLKVVTESFQTLCRGMWAANAIN